MMGYKDPDYQRKYHSRRWREDEAYRENHKEKLRIWRKKNPDRVHELDQKYHEKNRERRIAKHKEWIVKTSESIRAPLFEKQAGKCAICQIAIPNRIDHDYDNGFVRGLLCHRCNVGLSYVEDELYRQRAIEYIAYWRENPSGIRNPLIGRKAKRKRRMFITTDE